MNQVKSDECGMIWDVITASLNSHNFGDETSVAYESW